MSGNQSYGGYSGSGTITQALQAETLAPNEDAVSQILATAGRRMRDSDTTDSKAKDTPVSQAEIAAGSKEEKTVGAIFRGNVAVKEKPTNIEHETGASTGQNTGAAVTGNAELADLIVKVAPPEKEPGKPRTRSEKETGFKVKELKAHHGNVEVTGGGGTSTTGLDVDGDAVFSNGLNVTLRARR